MVHESPPGEGNRDLRRAAGLSMRFSYALFFGWLIIVLLVGFSRIPVLVERIVYYHEEVPTLEISDQMSAGYTIIVSVIVSLAALFYLRASGAFGGKKEATR